MKAQLNKFNCFNKIETISKKNKEGLYFGLKTFKLHFFIFLFSLFFNVYEFKAQVSCAGVPAFVVWNGSNQTLYNGGWGGATPSRVVYGGNLYQGASAEYQWYNHNGLPGSFARWVLQGTCAVACTNASISAHPSTSAASRCRNGTAFSALSVTGAGSATLSYQWQSSAQSNFSSGVSNVGTNSASYTPVNTTAGTLYYRCVVTSSCNSSTATSNASGAFTVTAEPSAGTLSGTQGICVAGSSTFSSTVAGGSWSSSNTGIATINASTGAISGVAAGTATMTYTVTGTGGCSNATATRTVTVTAAPSAGTLSGTQGICVAGSSTFSSTVAGGSWSSGSTGIATINSSTGAISGVAAGTATMTYTVTGTGGCSNATATRTATVNATNTAGTASSTPTLCINTALTNITRTTTGATGISNSGVSGANSLPAGVSATWSGNVITISGTPTAAGTFNYSIPLTGGCGSVNATGTITVTGETTSVNLSASNDASIKQGAATTTHASETFLESYPWTPSWTRRFLIRFDLSSIPAGATITSATLKLKTTGTYGSTRTIAAHRATDTWTEGAVTWNNAPAFNGTATTTTSVAANSTVYNWNVTSDVSAFIAGTAANYGWLMKENSEDASQNWWQFGSKENATEANRPILTVTYTSLTSSAASSTPTLCVNTALTNITHTTTTATGIGAATGLPTGVTAAWASNTITISGTPSAIGTFNYSIPLTGACGSVNATGTITVTATNVKLNNSTNLNVAGSWSCAVPTSTTLASWESSVTGANTTILGGNVSCLGVVITNPGGLVTISSGNTLSIFGSGIDMSASTQNLTMNNLVALAANQSWTINTSRTLTAANVVSGAFGITKAGAGTVVFGGANTYSGTTTITAGTVQLGASEVISNSSNVVMNGGTLSTGSAAGNSETVGTLTLNANSTINLGTGSHNLNFAASNGATWTGGALMRINGWTGGYNGTTGTAGKIYAGSSAELSAAKLNQIYFYKSGGGQYKASQLGTGEIVPTSALPVQLIYFNGELMDDNVLLSWQTASEINNEKFIVEKSFDANNWFSIAELKGAGNSANVLNYSFVDDALILGTQYYRLTQVDFDGAKETFQTIDVSKIATAPFEIKVFPNPMKEEVKVSFFADKQGYSRFRIYAESGQEMYGGLVGTVQGENSFNFNTSSFAEGTYIFKIEKENGVVSTVKVLK